MGPTEPTEGTSLPARPLGSENQAPQTRRALDTFGLICPFTNGRQRLRVAVGLSC